MLKSIYDDCKEDSGVLEGGTVLAPNNLRLRYFEVANPNQSKLKVDLNLDGLGVPV